MSIRQKATCFHFIVVIVAALVLASCGSGGGGSAQPTGANTAAAQFTVSSVQPAASATGVSVETTIAATFSDLVDPATVTGSTFLVQDSGGNSITGAISVTADSTAIFLPSASLSVSTTYLVTITSGVRGLSGRSLENNYTWSFTTSSTVSPPPSTVPPIPTPSDTTPPTVIGTSPASGAVGVAVSSTITATFSEAVASTTVNTATFLVRDSTGALVSGAVSLSTDGITAQFVPNANLASLTTYTATITTGVKDLTGNAMAADYAWSLTTASTASLSQSPFGFHPAGVVLPGSAVEYTDAQTIGVTRTRGDLYAFWSVIQPNLTTQTYDFTLNDAEYGIVPQGIAILANIAVQPPGSKSGYVVTGSYLPIDQTQYTAFVQALVTRYSTTGPNSMPGLTNPIKYWQVDNEPSATATNNFADLQRITYQAVKAVCVDCTVLIGGVPGFPPASQYIADFDTSYKPILDALHGQYVDVMDFHWYGQATGDYRGAGDVYKHIRSVLDADGFTSVPIWITEMGSYSGDVVTTATQTFPSQTERQQALDYVKRYVYSLSLGVKAVFTAFGMLDGLTYDGQYFDHTGVIYNSAVPGDQTTGQKKLAYYSYRKMTEKLEGSDWGSTTEVQAANNLYVYRLLRNGKTVYVAWWDYFNDATYTTGSVKPVTITGLTGATATVTEALPLYATGAEVTTAGYANSFRVTSVPVTSGSVTISLSDTPVYVETP